MRDNSIYSYSGGNSGQSGRGGAGDYEQEDPYRDHDGYTDSLRPPHVISDQDKQSRSFTEEVDLVDSICLDKDWNAEFQACLETADSVEKFRKLSNLARDFSYAARLYGSIIINEYYLSSEKKTIKPVVIGGIAGGHKYIALGILFKFALDTKGLYGGDGNAMKAAAHELKGLMSYYNCNVPQLHVPLMAIIDYHGFRLLAVSVLPIDKEIIYGSRDAGKTVFATNQEMNQLMRAAASRMNLKEHLVGDDMVALHSCGDIEGHIGKDNRFYLLDFARVFPPQYRFTNIGPPSHLFCLLRPELVKTNPVPLCSDALTGWVMTDPQSHIHNKEVKDATARLLYVVIPKFARWLDEYMEENSMKFNNKKNRPVLSDIIEELHRRGINVRHLGFVLSKVRYQPMQTALLTEIIARIMKCLILAQFRKKMHEYHIPCEEPYKETAANFLNLVFSRDTNGTEEHLFWGDKLQNLISHKFSVVYGNLNGNNEKDPDCNELFGGDAQHRVDLWLLVKRFLVLTGITLTKSAKVDLKENMGNFLLLQDDIEAIIGKCKFMNIIEHASGMVLFSEAEQTHQKEANRLFALASSRFGAALATFPLSVGTLYQWAKMLTTMASRAVDIAERTSLFKEAEDKLRYVLEIVPDYKDAKSTLAVLMHKYGCHLLDDHRPEIYDKYTRQAELLFLEALYLDVCELGEKTALFDRLSESAMDLHKEAVKESTFKQERDNFIAAHVRLRSLESFHCLLQDCEARRRPLFIRHVKLLIHHHASCLSHNRGDLAAGLMAQAAACLKRVLPPDQDILNYFQGTHTKWQLITLFLLSREIQSPEYGTPIMQRMQALTSFSTKMKSLPPSLLGRTLEGEAPLASLLDLLRYVRFLVLDSMPISDAIMAFLYFNFEQLDSLSVSGCKEITFIIPTSTTYNSSNSRAVLTPPLPPPAPENTGPAYGPPHKLEHDLFDMRSVTSSGSSTYTTPSFGYDDLAQHVTDIPPYYGLNTNISDDTFSDTSSPAYSPRNSVDLTRELRGFASSPPPELKVTDLALPTRSSVHSGHRSNSDSSTTLPLTKMKRSSSSTDAPQMVTSGNNISFLTGSWGENGKPPTRFSLSGGRSGSVDLTCSGTTTNTIIENEPTILSLPTSTPLAALLQSSDSVKSNLSSSSSGSRSLRNSLTASNPLSNSGSSININLSTSTGTTNPTGSPSVKRLSALGIGKTAPDTSPPAEQNSPRNRHSKLFSLTKSGGEVPTSTDNSSSPKNDSPICHHGGPRHKGQRFAEMQFLNISNCVSLQDNALQSIALHKLPLQCLYLSGCTKISDAGVIPLFNSCPQLKVLEINNCYKITDAAILELARHCSELKEVNVASCKLNASSIERLAKSCTNLSSLNITGVESISDYTLKVISQRCTNMHVLMLGHCPNITDSGIQYIANKLANSLQILTISNGAKITDASITALGNACSSLRTFKLRNALVSHNSVIALIQNNTMLTRLDLGGCHQVAGPIIDSLLRSGLSLRALKIAQCYGITNTNAFSDPYELFSNQTGLRNLTTLDWSETNLTNKVLENVCTHCQKLTKLKLQNCKLVTNQALGYISKHLIMLQKLRIDRCPQIDDGGIELLYSENTSRNLTTLSLIRIPITNKSTQVLSQFESLQNLHLSNSGNLTPDAMEKLLTSCIELQHVYLMLQNANTGTEKFLELKRKFPRVKLYFVESGSRK